MGVRGKRKDAQMPPRQGEEDRVPASDREVETQDNEPKSAKLAELTEAQRIALTHNWKAKIRNQKAILKAAEDEAKSEKGVLRNLWKQVKAELGDGAKEDIEDLLDLDTDEGKAKMEARVKQIAKAFDWGNVGLGQQLTLALEKFVDVRPDTEVAFNAGRLASYANEVRSPPTGYIPGTEKYQQWLMGYAAGQDELMKGFKPLAGLPSEGPPPPAEDAPVTTPENTPQAAE